MTPTQARSDCGHRSTGPRTVFDQSSARMRAPISPPPANTDSINCLLLRSMTESLDSDRRHLRYTAGLLMIDLRPVTQAIHEQVYHLPRIDGLFVAGAPA